MFGNKYSNIVPDQETSVFPPKPTQSLDKLSQGVVFW